MKEIIINTIFKEVGCRVHYDLVALTKNGQFYEIKKIKAANGKISEAIGVKDNASENIAKSELLRNYLRAGNLKSKTKKSILSYIKTLESNNENKNNDSLDVDFVEYGVQTCINEIINEESNKYLDKDKFIYNTSTHDIKKVINLIVESRINNISPYKLVQNYDVGTGNVHSWCKDINDLRILYTFYNLECDEIKSILSNYSKEDIREFEIKLIKEIEDNNRIDENIKKIYIDLINKNKFENKEENTISDADRYMKKIILDKVLNGSSGLSQEFVASKKEEILNFILSDDRILDIIIDNIELEI